MLIGKALQQSQIDPTEVEIFISHLLSKNRSFIKAFSDFELKDNHVVKLNEFIKRRVKHEPLAYILGYKEFCGLNFKVDSRVMIPRPETEELVSEVVKQVYAIPNRKRGNHWQYGKLKIIDVGTGSGNIAISLAKAIPFAKIYAVDKYTDALELAKENIIKHKATKQIKLIQGHLLEPIIGSSNLRQANVDIVVANLPYIPQSRLLQLPPEISKWEPKAALDGGKDGLELYRNLFEQLPSVLRPSGQLFYEIDGEVFTKVY